MKLRASHHSSFSPSAVLCQFCSVLPPDLFFADGYHTAAGSHQPSLSALKQSARNGCAFCLILAADSLFDGNVGVDDDHIVLGCQLPIEGEFIPYIRCQTRSGSFLNMIPFNGLPYCSKVDVVEEPSATARYRSEISVGELRAISEQVDSDATFDLMRSWIRFCRENHHGCREMHAMPMPTRLLDVGTLDSPRLYLRESYPSGHVSPYVTLSHCWGKPSPEEQERATTTCANIRSRRKQISIESLPKTFRDSITITRKLSVRFLWIDSLCIIQDSREDKEREIMNMGNVYSGSYCTIAASTSTGMHSGCFVQREALENRPLYLVWSANGKEVQKIVVFKPRPEWRNTFDNEPLNKRAWVFQERQLSPRTLHFTTHQIFWECRSSSASEMHPNSGLCMPPRKLEGQDEPIKLFEVTESGHDKLFQRWDFHTRWRRILEDYSSRKLTYQTDVMAALAGVATEFNSLMGGEDGEYIQGLWQSDLAQGLLWFVVRPQPLKKSDLAKKNDVYGPSWSWISVMGKNIEYPFTFNRPRPVLPADNKLRLNKPSRDPEIRCPQKSASYLKPIPETLEVLGYLKKARMQNCKPVENACDLGDAYNPHAVRLGTMFCDTQADLEENREVWILSMWDYMQIYSRNGIGLVLVPSSERKDLGSTCDVFARIGMADTLDLQHFDDCRRQKILLI